MRLFTARRVHRPSAPRRAFTLLEVVVATAILLAGVVAIARLFPMTLNQNRLAADRAQAAFLAQAKAEELRRDNYSTGGGNTFIDEIGDLATPTPPLVFPRNSHFVYRLSGESPLEPADDPGTPRVLIYYNPDFRPDARILFELKFQQ